MKLAEIVHEFPEGKGPRFWEDARITKPFPVSGETLTAITGALHTIDIMGTYPPIAPDGFRFAIGPEGQPLNADQIEGAGILLRTKDFTLPVIFVGTKQSINRLSASRIDAHKFGTRFIESLSSDMAWGVTVQDRTRYTTVVLSTDGIITGIHIHDTRGAVYGMNTKNVLISPDGKADMAYEIHRTPTMSIVWYESLPATRKSSMGGTNFFTP